jgi:hypothetical protein
MDALKPCPFCGGEGRLFMPSYPLSADCADAEVRCSDCDAAGQPVLIDMDTHGESDWPGLQAEAITAWNTRTEARNTPVETVADADIPALLRSAIHALERYDAPSRPAMLQLAAHLRGVLEYPADAEEAVRRCASLDANGYIAEKAAIIAALRARRVVAHPTPPAPVEAATIEDADDFTVIDERVHPSKAAALDAALEATQPAPVEAEPVAWMRQENGAYPEFTWWPSTADAWRDTSQNVKALYDHPTPPAVDRLVGALEPFATFAENVDENGWKSNIHKERISDWFGPTDFRRATEALASFQEVGR